MDQLGFDFDTPEGPRRLSLPPLQVADPRVRREAVPRLNRQQAAILEAFRAAPGRRLANHSLLAYSIRYSARILELRRAGHAIELVEHDHATGRTVYELRERPCPA